MMRARLANAWENATSSLWFLPTLLVAASATLAAVALLIDERVPELGGTRSWFFGGNADSAQTLLSTIAGSLITVAALAFAVTIVAIQQASSQLSPRVLRNFMRDRGNQAVFGVFIATFVYALLVLRQIRQPDEAGRGAFVPAFSITMALALTLTCIALLIYFIHHIASSLQVATIAERIRVETQEQIEQLFPQDAGLPTDERAAASSPALTATLPALTVRSAQGGYLRSIDEETLFAALGTRALTVRVPIPIGRFVLTGTTIAEVWGQGAATDRDLEQRLRAAFTFARERSHRQDIFFGIRQLADIALKALSPGINDPTTAELCLSHLGDTIAVLAHRRFPASTRRHPTTGATLILQRPDFAAVVAAAFDQIRREASADPHVTGYLLDVLADIAALVPTSERATALRRQADEIALAVAAQDFSSVDKAALHSQIRAVRDALDRAAQAPTFVG